MPKTIKNRISNCKKVNKYYDLDKYYDENKTKELFKLLNYTSEDKKNDLKPKHKIPINGDIYNGTATYKNAMSLYFEFKDSLSEKIENNSIEKSEINEIDTQVFEIIDDLGYKKNIFEKISIFQNLIYENLDEKRKGYEWKYEYKISEKYRDRIDIYGYNPLTKHHYVIELDPHRSDSIAKKFVSRIALLINEKVTYMSICYTGTKKMNINECLKYFNYCNTIANSIKVKYFGKIL